MLPAGGDGRFVSINWATHAVETRCVSTGQLLHTIMMPGDAEIQSICLIPGVPIGDNLLVTADDQGTLQLYDIEKGSV